MGREMENPQPNYNMAKHFKGDKRYFFIKQKRVMVKRKILVLFVPSNIGIEYKLINHQNIKITMAPELWSSECESLSVQFPNVCSHYHHYP